MTMSSLDNCVVKILGKSVNSQLAFLGTGVIIDEFCILTCWHIIFDKAANWQCEPHEVVIFIQTNQDDSLIKAAIQNFNDRYDLLLLSADATLPLLDKIVFLRDIVKPFNANLLGAAYWLHGYDGQHAGEVLGHWPIPPLMPGFDALSDHKLFEFQFSSGIPEGSSGSPVFISAGERNFCIGVAWLGSKRSPTSRVVASDPILTFLKSSGVESLDTQDAEIVLKSPLLNKRTSTVSSARTSKLPLLLGSAGLSVCLVAVIVLFAAWPKGRTYLRYVFLRVSKDAPAVPISQPALGVCDATLKQQVFHKADSFKILALRFGVPGSINSPANQEGYATGRWVWEQMQRYQREQTSASAWQTSGFNSDAIEVEFEPCMVEKHPAALAIGQARGADVVVWGTIVMPRPDDSRTAKVRPFVTAIQWLNASAESPRRVPVPELEQLEFPQIASKQPLALIEFLFGVFALERQRFDLASIYFMRSMQEIQVSGEEQGRLQEWVGRSYVVSGHEKEGLTLLRESQAKCRLTDKRCRTQSLNSFVWALGHLGRHAEAAEAAQELLALSKETGEVQYQSGAYSAISARAFYEGHQDEAIQQGRLALQLAFKSGDAQVIGSAVNNFSVCLYKFGMANEAIKNLEQILILLQGQNYLNEEGAILENIGKIHSDQGDGNAALSSYSKALEKISMAGDKEHQAHLLGLLGERYLQSGKFDEAVKHYNRAIELWNELSIISEETLLAEKSRGDALYRHGNANDALIQYQQLLHRLQSKKNKSPYAEASLYRAIGYALMQAKPTARPLEAIDAYQKAILSLPKDDKQLRPDILSGMARASLSAGNNTLGVQQLAKSAAAFKLRSAIGDDGKAFAELETACDISELTHNDLAYQSVIGELPRVGLDKIRNAAIRARYFSWKNQRRDANREYQRVIDLARSSSTPIARMLLIMARAGMERQRQGGRIQGCRGVVITDLPKGCKETSEKFKTGDIILQIQNSNTCINTSLDFSKQGPLLPQNKVLVWRAGTRQLVAATNQFYSMSF